MADVSDMLTELDDHGFDDVATARKLSKINEAYFDICGRAPWPFLETTTSLTFAGGSTTPETQPADFRAVTAMVITAGGGLGQRVRRIRRDEWLEQYAGLEDTGGVPLYFYTIGSTIHFWPSPTADVQVTMDYIKVPPALTAASLSADILIPAQYQQAIVEGALFKLYSMEDDTDIAPTFETYFERSIQNMHEVAFKQDYSTNETVYRTDDWEWFGH